MKSIKVGGLYKLTQSDKKYRVSNGWWSEHGILAKMSGFSDGLELNTVICCIKDEELISHFYILKTYQQIMFFKQGSNLDDFFKDWISI